MRKEIISVLVLLLLITPLASSMILDSGEYIDASTGYPSYWSGVVQHIGKDNLTIENYTIYNAPYFGIYIKNCNNVLIRNCLIYNSQSSGIIARYCNNVTISNCKIITCCINGEQEGITLQDVNGFKVLGCLVMDSYKEGIDAKSGSSNGLIKGNYVINCRDVRPGIYVDAFEDDTEDITIMNNVVIGTGQGISLATENGGSLKNIWIKYNYVDVESNAFSIHRYDAPGTNLKINIYVIYNLLKSRDARSVHITDYPSNLINLRLFNNMKIGPIVWLR